MVPRRNALSAVALAALALGGVATAQPFNDDCDNALAVVDGDYDFSNAGAVQDGPSLCGIMGSDIWFLYTAPCDGTVNVSTCNQASYDTVLAAYNDSGNCPPTNADNIICLDDVTGCAGFTTMIDFPVAAGASYLIQVGGFSSATGSGSLTITCSGTFPTPDPEFVRGDADGNGDFDGLVDALYLLFFQFASGPAPPCMEAADVDGDGTFNGIPDSIYALFHQFSGGPAPPAPYPACGADPAPMTSLGCDPTPGCP